jgi:serine/threonine protein kinase
MKICSVCQRCYDDQELYCDSEDSSLLTDSRPGHCEMIDGYLIESLTGADHRTELYGARHVGSGRACLISLLNVPPPIAEGFLREAENASSLMLPKIADVYGSGQLADGRVYLVSEDIRGESLRDILDRQTTLDLLHAISIMGKAAEAAHSLHLKGLLHLAIRPENIIVTGNSVDDVGVRLRDADLGGSIWRSIMSDKFTIDASLYELRYFSPEQCSGATVNIKSDVYALGIVLYEMLAGRTPFNAGTAAGIIEKHLSQRPPEITIDDFELRMLAAHTLMESLSKRPEDRQSSANAFARQLRHIEQLATHVSTPPPATTAPPWPQRAPAIAEAVAVSATVVPTFVATEQMREVPTDLAATPPVEIEVVPPALRHPADLPATLTNFEPAVSAYPVEAGDHVVGFPPASHRARHRRRIRKLHSKTVSAPAPVKPLAKGPVTGPAKPTPRKVELSPLDDDIPSMDDVAAALAEMPIQVTATTERPADPARMEIPEPTHVTDQPIVRVPEPVRSTKTAESDADEITVETARRRPVRIDIEAPKQRPRKRPQVGHIAPAASAQLMFFPTLLGSGAREALEPDTGHSIFGYRSELDVSGPLNFQKAAIAAGALVVAALIFFNVNTAWQNAQSVASTGSPVAADSRAVQPETPAVNLPSVVKKKDSKTGPELKPGGDPSRADSGRRRLEIRSSDDKARLSVNKTTEKQTRPNRSQNDTKTKAAAMAKRTDKTTNPDPVKLSGTTRPRIVKVPK